MELGDLDDLLLIPLDGRLVAGAGGLGELGTG